MADNVARLVTVTKILNSRAAELRFDGVPFPVDPSSVVVTREPMARPVVTVTFEADRVEME